MLARVPALLALPSLIALLASCGGPSVELSDTLSVVHVSPSHGSVEVRLDPTITLGFSDAVDERTLRDTLSLRSLDEEGDAEPVAARIFLDESGFVATLIPETVLEEQTLHRVEVEDGLRSTAGAALVAPYRAEFVTRAAD